jgi:16S rRNA (adenine1518-N6/adenine1519-N6)-dimethyltransferase
MDLKDHVRATCRAFDLHLERDLGQHFLIDEQILEMITEGAGIEESDHIVEIGPGIGVLTKELLTRAKHVTAIELDRRFIPILKHLDLSGKKLTIIQGNALQIPMPNHHYKIVANIPYHITSPLLRHVFLEFATRPSSLTLLLQREVAENICDTKNAGMLTILVALFGTPSILTLVPPDAFLPPPRVDSAVLHIESFPEPRASRDVIDSIFTLTKHAFSGKRKMLRNTMSSLPGGLDALDRAGVDATRRPQTL